MKKGEEDIVVVSKQSQQLHREDFRKQGQRQQMAGDTPPPFIHTAH